MDCLVGWPPGTMPRLRLLLHLVGVFIIMFFFFFFSQLLVASHTPTHTHTSQGWESVLIKDDEYPQVMCLLFLFCLLLAVWGRR